MSEPIDYHNLGIFTTLEKVYKTYPNGGSPGDYVTISGVITYWNDTQRTWGTQTPIPSDGSDTKQVDGNLSVTGNLTVGGSINNLDEKIMAIEESVTLDDDTLVQSVDPDTSKFGLISFITIFNRIKSKLDLSIESDLYTFGQGIVADALSYFNQGIHVVGGIVTDAIEALTSIKIGDATISNPSGTITVDKSVSVSGNLTTTEDLKGRNVSATAAFKVGEGGEGTAQYNASTGQIDVNKGVKVNGNSDVAGDHKVTGKQSSYDMDVANNAKIHDITLLEKIQSETFAGDLTGFGIKIHNDNGKWRAEFDSLSLRESLTVPSLVYNRTQINVGDKWNAPGGGKILSVVPDNIGGVIQNTGTVTLKLEEGDIGAIAVNDKCMGIYHNFLNTDMNAPADLDDSKGNRTIKGFFTSYFIITGVSGADNSVFTYTLRAGYTTSHYPASGMTFVCYSNATDTARQTSSYETRTYIRHLCGMTGWEITASNIAAQFGDLSNLSVHGINMTGYSAYLNNIYMKGVIKQFEEKEPELSLYFPLGSYIKDGESGTATAKITDGYGTDITDSYSIIWTRNSGQSYDVDWNATHTTPSKTLALSFTDLGGATSATFAATSTRSGSTTLVKTLTLRQVVNGTTGPTLYTWIKYATSSVGAGLSDSPSGMTYIGFAYNKTTATESTTASDYTWSLIKGTDGVAGAPGADGTTTYTWIKYSDVADGTGLYDTPTDTTLYIGIAVNKTTATESTTKTDYVWSKFKGDQGVQGATAFKSTVFIRSNTTPTIPTGGSFASPIPTSTPAWSDGVPSGTSKLWMSTRIFTSDGLSPQQSFWTAVSEATSTAGLEVQYSSVANSPSDPTTTPANWSSTASTDSIWQALRIITNGVAGAWQIVKVKGETGNTGTSIIWKGSFSTAPTSPSNGWAYYNTTDGQSYVYQSGWSVMSKDAVVYVIEPDVSIVKRNAAGICTPSSVGFKVYQIKGGKKTEIDYYYKGSYASTAAAVTALGEPSAGWWIIVGAVNYRYDGEAWVVFTPVDTSLSLKMRVIVNDDFGWGNTFGPYPFVTGKVAIPAARNIIDAEVYLNSGGWTEAERLAKVRVVVVDDGAKGDKGDNGDQGDKGLQGCIVRVSEFAYGVEYRNDENVTDPNVTRYIDIVTVTTGLNEFSVYKCKATHSSQFVVNITYWEVFNTLQPVYTPLILAQNAVMRFGQANQLLIMKNNGTITAGASGLTDGVRFWAGATTPAAGKWKVYESGHVYEEDADIKGSVKALDGYFGDFAMIGRQLGGIVKNSAGTGYVESTKITTDYMPRLKSNAEHWKERFSYGYLSQVAPYGYSGGYTTTRMTITFPKFRVVGCSVSSPLKLWAVGNLTDSFYQTWITQLLSSDGSSYTDVTNSGSFLKSLPTGVMSSGFAIGDLTNYGEVILSFAYQLNIYKSDGTIYNTVATGFPIINGDVWTGITIDDEYTAQLVIDITPKYSSTTGHTIKIDMEKQLANQTVLYGLLYQGDDHYRTLIGRNGLQSYNGDSSRIFYSDQDGFMATHGGATARCDSNGALLAFTGGTVIKVTNGHIQYTFDNWATTKSLT